MSFWRKIQDSLCGGIGGVRCHCCNKFKGRSLHQNKILNRLTRRKLKRETRKQINNELFL